MTRILVVDDDRASADGLGLLLRSDGYEVVAMQSSVAARDLLLEERFDAIITDLEMPEVHGVEIVERARASSPSPPVLVISAYTDSPAGAIALKKGACKLIPKPIDYDELSRALASALAAAKTG